MNRNRSLLRGVVYLLMAGLIIGGVIAIGGGSAAGVVTEAVSSEASTATLADHPEDEAGFVVVLEENGDAEIVIIYTYDLEDEADRQAFERLQLEDEHEAAFLGSFESRLSGVVSETREETNRNMALSDAAIDIGWADEVGLVTLSATWSSLAAETGEGLVLTEPFASGFESDRPFRVVIPTNSHVVSVTPQPDTQSGQLLTWDAGRSLDGFELVVSPDEDDVEPVEDDDDEPEEADDSGHGFGVPIVVLAIATALLVRARQ